MLSFSKGKWLRGFSLGLTTPETATTVTCENWSGVGLFSFQIICCHLEHDFNLTLFIRLLLQQFHSDNLPILFNFANYQLRIVSEIRNAVKTTLKICKLFGMEKMLEERENKVKIKSFESLFICVYGLCLSI